jgi:hypothetical protein
MHSLLFWSMALIFGFPLLVIVLGEISQRLTRRRIPLAHTLRIYPQPGRARLSLPAIYAVCAQARSRRPVH